jgi:hypothetical protein
MLVVRERDARALVFAVTVIILVAPLTIEPAPDVLVLAFREVAALLAGYVLWIAIRTLPPALNSPRLGGTPEAAFVAVAFVLGLLVAGSGPGPAGPPAVAASLAVGLAAVNLLLFAPDPVRLGIGAMLFLLASSVAAGWLGGRLFDASHISIAIALLAAAVATAWIAVNAASARGDMSAARPRDAEGTG